MAVYWALFSYFSLGVFTSQGGLATSNIRRIGPLFVFGFLATAILIGFRYKVGADWDNYMFMYNEAGRFSLSQLLMYGDPSYQLVNWIGYQSGQDIWVVNSICGLTFSYGLARFCRVQPDPWLAALVSIPYLVIVVAMGYTRQAVALGILMAGLAQVMRGASSLRFAPYVLAAATFHGTAVVFYPLVALATSRNRAVNFIIVVFGTYFLYDYFLGSNMDKFVQSYVEREYTSQGAFIRVAMNAIAAAIFWIAKDSLAFSDHERRIWKNFSLAALGFLGLFFVFPSSTAVDRMSLYVIPLQIAVLTRVAYVGGNRTVGSIGVMLYLFAVQFVWLNYAQHARYWLPYHFFPI